GQGGTDDVFWFGGGLDLTPYYPVDDDVRHFHQVCHDAVAPFGEDKYPRYKAWCDDYFLLRHRGETRGVGGLFFDDLNEPDFDTCFALTRAVGDCFVPAYAPIVRARRDTPYGERERAFQAYRRGRYVEFNLVYDRVDATWNSTWSTTGARCSACNRAAVRNPSCCPCRPSPNGATTGRPSPDPPNRCWPTTCGPAHGCDAPGRAAGRQ